MSWSAGRPWDEVLEAFAAANGFSVKIDWTERSVFLRPTEVARLEGAGAPPSSEATAASSVSKSGAAEARQPPQTGVGPAAAFNKATLAEVLKQVAAVHGYSVAFDTSAVSFTGPVTLLGADIVEDLQLVQRALGSDRSPVAFQVFRANRKVRVLDRTADMAVVAVVDAPLAETHQAPVPDATRPATDAAVAATLPAPAVAVSAPQPSGTVPPAASGVPGAVSAPVPKAVVTQAMDALPARQAPSGVAFVAPEGQPLSASMKQFFESNGWKLSWKADDIDFVPEFPVILNGESVADVLRKLKLPRFGLAVDLWTHDRVAVVRAFDPAQDR
jgi:hypothetical protein